MAYGGAETYYVKLAKILQTKYRLIAVVASFRLYEEFTALGIEARFIGDHLGTTKRYSAGLHSCLALIVAHRPPLAHLNGQPESYLAPFLRLCGLRVVTTRHTPFTNLFLREGSRIPILVKKHLIVFCLRLSSVTFCVSRLLQIQLLRYLSSSHLPVITTWIEDSMLDNYERPLPSLTLRALFVGRIANNKGIFEVIEAIRHCQGVHLTVVGDGPEMKQARQKADGLPITFAGFYDDCRGAYRSADLLIFASPEGFEGLPQVPLEAMAMGVPCLASNISSILEIAEGEPGAPAALLLYNVKDPDDLVTQLARLVKEPDLLATVGRAGKSLIQKRFTRDAVTNAYLREFSRAIE